ncbi:MAG: hypothetical protein ACTHKX_02885 [Pseudolysinimonas sp.]
MTLPGPIAGITPLRLLAEGGRAQVWLATGDRVLKVVETGAEAIAEATALQRAEGEHVVELLDLAIDDDDALLVLPRLSRGSLAPLLERRSGRDAGVAVTLLAPIAACLGRLHIAGVAHAAVSADHILFREDGAPVLIGFGSSQLFEPGLSEVHREQVDGVVDDLRALRALADMVLRRVTGPRAAAALDLAEQLALSGTADAAAMLSSDLFDLAASRPIRFDQDEESVRAPMRVVGLTAPPPQSTGEAQVLLSRALEFGPARLVREAVRRRWGSWSARGRRLALAVASATVVTVVAVLAIPSPAPSVAPVGSGAPDPDPVSSSAGDAAPTAPREVVGDDPLAALGPLLSRRTECFRELSEVCLADVDEQGSSAWSDDRAALDAIVDHAQQPVLLDAGGAELVQRLGDSALIALAPDTEPASLLLLKGEAGWRIRDYVAGADG